MIYTNPNNKAIPKEQTEFLEAHGLEVVQQYPSCLDEISPGCSSRRLHVLHSSGSSALCTGQWNCLEEGK